MRTGGLVLGAEDWELGTEDWGLGIDGLELGAEDWELGTEDWGLGAGNWEPGAWSWGSQEDSETDAVDVRGKSAQTAAVTNRHA